MTDADDETVKAMRAARTDLADIRRMMALPDIDLDELPDCPLVDLERAAAMVVVIQRELLRNQGWTDERIDQATLPVPDKAEDGSRLN